MKKLFILSLLFFAIPLLSFAADISFNTEKKNYSVNEEVIVKVFMDTKDETANAVEGAIVFPPETLEFKEFREGNSVINFWIEKGGTSNPGRVTFSGITPGGFSGPSNFLFSLVFRAKKSGTGSLGFDGLRVLKNDGQGTKIETASSALSLSVSSANGASGGEIVLKDLEAPEAFHISLGQDESIFYNKFFIVFSAIDKGLGIDHYEVREGKRGEFKPATSPYLLEDQTLSKKIFVKAIDKNGNERVATLDAQNQKAWYENYVILAILVLLVCAFIVKKLWPRLIK
jgi:hypothetical protein